MSAKRFTDSGNQPAPRPRGMSGVWNQSSWNPKPIRGRRKKLAGTEKCITWFPIPKVATA